jgi:hypothetical protein
MERPLGFARQYRAALLGYLLSGVEAQRARAYDLGRAAVAGRISLLDLVRTHHLALHSLLEATPRTRRVTAELKAADDFLLEAITPFEMASRGYLELLQRDLTR